MADALSPSPDDLLSAWRERVAADLEQVNRCREVDDPADFYAPVTSRFRMDPRRTDDATLNERDGRYAFEWTPTKVGIVGWSPRS